MRLYFAGPGAGKTRQLTLNTEELLNDGVSPLQIILTTFSREAAAEITRRVGGDVTARTTHGLANWVLGLEAEIMGKTPPNILDEEEALMTMQRAIQETGGDLAILKPRKVFEAMLETREQGKTLLAEYEESCERYAEIMKQTGKIDFTGILERGKTALQNPDVRDTLTRMRVLVDEAQDMNPLQWAFMEGLYDLTLSENIQFFASPSQVIYKFNGSDWDYIFRKMQERGELDLVVLDKNYRSTPQIVMGTIPLATGPDGRNIQPANEENGEPVHLVEAFGSEAEVDFIGRQIAYMIRGQNVSPKDIAVLTRTHEQGQKIQKMFGERQIPYSLPARGQHLFQREEVIALLGFLKWAQDPLYEGGLDSMINFPPCGLGSRSLRMIRGDENLEWKHLARVMARPEEHRQQVVERVYQMASIRERIADLPEQAPDLKTLVKMVAEESGLMNYLQGEGDFNAHRAVRALIDTSHEYINLDDLIESWETLKAQSVDSTGVNIQTFHGSKGLGWDHVFIPNSNDGVTPIKGGDDVEEQNLFYVAATRAISTLWVSWDARQRPSGYLRMIPSQYSDRRQWPHT